MAYFAQKREIDIAIFKYSSKGSKLKKKKAVGVNYKERIFVI